MDLPCLPISRLAKLQSITVTNTLGNSDSPSPADDSRNGPSGDGHDVTSMKTGSFVGDMIAEGLLIWSGKPLLLKLAAEFEAWSKLKDEGADASVDRS
ncbi:hypothetical protein K435DRAFT_869641 [Dendrothele bispora CBS 962.96]|uniref:Uncharacterized protein n=1 Tax=Dendrothele bispora (strain CBS 962.96) TaxID=1314807 RepID=A0A4V4HCY8_DENBC|nr:hypothetical protein K435DRAFT_869641 [Dendrothele bispora CBS 962.96]